MAILPVCQRQLIWGVMVPFSRENSQGVWEIPGYGITVARVMDGLEVTSLPKQKGPLFPLQVGDQIVGLSWPGESSADDSSFQSVAYMTDEEILSGLFADPEITRHLKIRRLSKGKNTYKEFELIWQPRTLLATRKIEAFHQTVTDTTRATGIRVGVIGVATLFFFSRSPHASAVVDDLFFKEERIRCFGDGSAR